MEIVRTRDMKLANSILSNPAIDRTIRGNSTDSIYPSNRNNHIYFTSFINDRPIGLVIMHLDKYEEWQIHIQILPEYRLDYAEEFGVAGMQWIWDNTDIDTLNAKIPECYPNVKDFALLMGFRIVDLIPDDYIEGTESFGRWVLRIDKGKL